MSKLRWADYTEHLAGKTIKQVRWFNDEQLRNLSVVFTDDTRVDFCFTMSLEEDAEIADFKNGDISNERLLRPVPVVKPERKTE